MESLWWLWLILLPLAALAGILVFVAWFARQVTDRIIGRKHHWIEEIMNSVGQISFAFARWRLDITYQ